MMARLMEVQHRGLVTQLAPVASPLIFFLNESFNRIMRENKYVMGLGGP
jgi:hypothetical protein